LKNKFYLETTILLIRARAWTQSVLCAELFGKKKKVLENAGENVSEAISNLYVFGVAP